MPIVLVTSAPERQQDHADVPQRPAVVPEAEVEAVQAVVEPALDAVQAMNRRDELAELGIDVDPGLERVVELHAQHGQRGLAVARVVIRVVVGRAARASTIDASGAAARRRASSVSVGERLGARGQRARVDEHVLRLGAAGDRVRLMQPLAARVRLGACARVTREVVRRVVDASKLDLLQRPAGEQRGPGSAANGGNCSSSTGPPVSASSEISRLVGVRPVERLHRQEAAEDPRQREDAEEHTGDVMPAHPALIANDVATSETASTCETA